MIENFNGIPIDKCSKLRLYSWTIFKPRVANRSHVSLVSTLARKWPPGPTPVTLTDEVAENFKGLDGISEIKQSIFTREARTFHDHQAFVLHSEPVEQAFPCWMCSPCISSLERQIRLKIQNQCYQSLARSHQTIWKSVRIDHTAGIVPTISIPERDWSLQFHPE